MGMQMKHCQTLLKNQLSYEEEVLDSTLSVIIADNERTEAVSEGQALLVFAKTPFYAEMGGQVADHGVIKNDKGDIVARVTDVQKHQTVKHFTQLKFLQLVSWYNIYTEIDSKRRHSVIKTTQLPLASRCTSQRYR